MRLIRRWLRRLKLWLAIQALPVIDPELSKESAIPDVPIEDASEVMRKRRGRQ